MSNFEKVQELINQSELKTAEKKFLINLFSKAKDEDLANVADILAKYPAYTKKLYDNALLKESALVSGNADAWDAIVKAEEKELGEIY